MKITLYITDFCIKMWLQERRTEERPDEKSIGR